MSSNSQTLQTAFHEKLRTSGLGVEDAKKLKLKLTTIETAVKDLSSQIPVLKSGFIIPYFDLNGKPTKFWRYRYLENTKTGFNAATDKKALRYAQPPKSTNEVYIPPFVDWKTMCLDPSKEVVITEGELKAACGCRFGIPTMGLGGVWSWRSAKDHMAMLPLFEDFVWKGRPVVICYDSDVANNHKVIQAENALAKALTKKGAAVRIARLPFLSDGRRAGMDDYIVESGPKALLSVLDEAFPWREAQELHKLNEEVIYVADPGLVLKLDTLQKISPRAFYEHAYAPRVFYEETITEKGTKLTEKSAAREWLKWPHRATATRITYAPGEPRIAAGALNTWTGFGVEPKKGDIKLWKQLLDFVFAGLSPENRRWVEQWMAYPLQHPGAKLYTAVVLWGLVHGTGKSLIGYTLGEVYGKNFTEIADKDLVTTYNEWAENKQFVMGDEITGGDKRSSADRMKSMITQRQLRLNPKYVPSYTVPDCINYYFTSNHPDAFFLEDTDRRFFIHEVAGEPMPDTFYKSYDQALKNGELVPALFHHLLNLPMDGFNPQGHAPQTASKAEMIENGKSDIATWVAALKTDPNTVLRINNKPIMRDLWTTSELHHLYDPQGNKKVTLNGLSREMRRAGMPKAYNGMPVPTYEGSQRLWVLRNHKKYDNAKGTTIGTAYDRERGQKSGKY